MPAWDKRPPPRDSRVGTLIWAVPHPRDGDGSVNPPRKAIAVVLGLLLLGVSNVGMAGRATAAQNRPSWSPGDYWVYTSTEGGATATIRQSVIDKTTVTVGATTYSTWHTTMSTSVVSGGTTITLTFNSWVVENDLATVRTNGSIFLLGDFTITYDPPMSMAVFPLAPGSSWSKSTTQTTTSGLGSSSQVASYSGVVTGEVDVTVPAGTFQAAVIRSPASGNPYTLSYYSERIGNTVRTDGYDAGGAQTSTQSLTEYRYQNPGSTLALLVVIGVAAMGILAALAFVVLRRREQAGRWTYPQTQQMSPQASPRVPPEAHSPPPPQGPPFGP